MTENGAFRKIKRLNFTPHVTSVIVSLKHAENYKKLEIKEYGKSHRTQFMRSRS